MRRKAVRPRSPTAAEVVLRARRFPCGACSGPGLGVGAGPADGLPPAPFGGRGRHTSALRSRLSGRSAGGRGATPNRKAILGSGRLSLAGRAERPSDSPRARRGRPRMRPLVLPAASFAPRVRGSFVFQHREASVHLLRTERARVVPNGRRLSTDHAPSRRKRRGRPEREGSPSSRRRAPGCAVVPRGGPAPGRPRHGPCGSPPAAVVSSRLAPLRARAASGRGEGCLTGGRSRARAARPGQRRRAEALQSRPGRAGRGPQPAGRARPRPCAQTSWPRAARPAVAGRSGLPRESRRLGRADRERALLSPPGRGGSRLRPHPCDPCRKIRGSGGVRYPSSAGALRDFAPLSGAFRAEGLCRWDGPLEGPGSGPDLERGKRRSPGHASRAPPLEGERPGAGGAGEGAPLDPRGGTALGGKGGVWSGPSPRAPAECRDPARFCPIPGQDRARGARAASFQGMVIGRPWCAAP